MSKTTTVPHPALDHGVPFLWPFAAAVEMGELGSTLAPEGIAHVVVTDWKPE